MANLIEMYKEAEKLKDEGNYEGAVEKLREIVAEDEKFALAHFALAVNLGRVGKHEEAVKHGQRACELEPQDPFSFTALSLTYQRAFAGTQDQKYIQLAEDARDQAHRLEGH